MTAKTPRVVQLLRMRGTASNASIDLCGAVVCRFGPEGSRCWQQCEQRQSGPEELGKDARASGEESE